MKIIFNDNEDVLFSQSEAAVISNNIYVRARGNSSPDFQEKRHLAPRGSENSS